MYQLVMTISSLCFCLLPPGFEMHISSFSQWQSSKMGGATLFFETRNPLAGYTEQKELVRSHLIFKEKR